MVGNYPLLQRVALQAEINPAVKDGDNPFAKTRYAILNSVVEASREALLKHGIWLVQYAVPVEAGHVGLVTKLVHAASGQWQASLMVMPLQKADPQGYGSALTYARRYSLATLVGLVVEDDDGEAAYGRSRRGQKKIAKEESTNRNNSRAVLETLPRFEGINYQLVNVPDGRPCVIATGNTSAKRDLLSGSGFKWNPDRKIWWRYADAAEFQQ
ncbi:single-stranded DNA-binding protein [Deltaproteobacteria bacterium Smac51]|nr:single-stranded DNA-binding protein [Deltaproteobacteria bacterium Smac51]